MVTCSQIVDGGRWTMKSPRPLVYDVETRSLRYCKSRNALNSRLKSPDPIIKVDDAQLGNDSPVQHKLLGKLTCRGGSGETSPTCVIQNSALRSNSSSPTMSTISKASSDPGRKSHDLEGRSYSASTKFARTTLCLEYDEEFVANVCPGSEPHKTGDVRGRKKHGNIISRRPVLKEPPLRRMEYDCTCAKENGCTVPHETPTEEVKDAQATPPFKSIQCAAADKTQLEAAKHKKNPSSITRPASQSASIMHKAPGIFSFNATYISTIADSDLDDFDLIHADSPKETIDPSRRAFTTPLLKPTPSKWDDAEKWLPGSEALNPAKANSRCSPLLAQMVASQAGMSIPWKGHLVAQTKDPGLGQRGEGDETVLVKGGNANPTLVTDVIDFSADEKEQLSLLRDQYPEEQGDGSFSPSCMNGSFMKLGTRMPKPLATKPSPETRDMGTAMTPIPSVEPSRTGTPVRATTPEKRRDVKSLEESKMATSCDNDADSGMRKPDVAESPRALTAKELQEKTRQEIVALGTQLGKASIAAAWAARVQGEDCKTALDLENIRRDVCASRADSWKDSQKVKYISRFQQEETKIQAWEEQEKAKAEAEMRRVEAKAERMKTQAHEKLANKLAAARRQAEACRLAAEAKRAVAAAKAARKAQLMKNRSIYPPGHEMATCRRRRPGRNRRMRRRGRLRRRGRFARRKPSQRMTPGQRAKLIHATIKRRERELLMRERKRARVQEYRTKVVARREKLMELARLKRMKELDKRRDIRQRIRARKAKAREKQAMIMREKREKELAKKIGRYRRPTESDSNGKDWIC